MEMFVILALPDYVTVEQCFEHVALLKFVTSIQRMNGQSLLFSLHFDYLFENLHDGEIYLLRV